MLLITVLFLLNIAVFSQNCRSYDNCAQCVSNLNCNFDQGTCAEGPTKLNFNRWEEKVEFCYSFSSYSSYAQPFCGSTSISVLDQNVSVNYVNRLFGTAGLMCKYEFVNLLLENIEMKVNLVDIDRIEATYWTRNFGTDSSFTKITKATEYALDNVIMVIVYTRMSVGVSELPFEFGISVQVQSSMNRMNVIVFIIISIVLVFLIMFACNWARNRQIVKERERRRRRIREIIALANNIRINGLLPEPEEEQAATKNKIDSQIEGKVLENETEGEKCTICQESLKKGNEVGNLKCNHLFHLLCIREWLYVSKEKACPNCKEVLVSEPESARPEIEVIDVRRNFIAALTGQNRFEDDVVRIEDERVSSSSRNLTVNQG